MSGIIHPPPWHCQASKTWQLPPSNHSPPCQDSGSAREIGRGWAQKTSRRVLLKHLPSLSLCFSRFSSLDHSSHSRARGIAIETQSRVPIHFAAITDAFHDDLRVRQFEDDSVIAVAKSPLATSTTEMPNIAFPRLAVGLHLVDDAARYVLGEFGKATITRLELGILKAIVLPTHAAETRAGGHNQRPICDIRV